MFHIAYSITIDVPTVFHVAFSKTIIVYDYPLKLPCVAKQGKVDEGLQGTIATPFFALRNLWHNLYMFLDIWKIKVDK